MYCLQCGSPVREGEKFCAKCGAPQKAAGAPAQPEYGYTPPPQTYAQPEPGPEYYQQQPYNPQAAPQYAPMQLGSDPNAYGYVPTEPTYTPQPPMQQPPDSQYPGYADFAPAEPAKKKGMSKLLKFGVPIAAVVAVAVVAVILLFASSSPTATATKALGGLATEAGERIANSPLKAFVMMGETLSDGKLTVDFKYRDDWYDEEVSGSVRLFSNTKENDYALEADVNVYDNSYDLAIYANKERLAVGSRLMDNNYYGFKYSTFRDDIRGFGGVVGLDNKTMDSMSDIVDIISDLMNTEDKGAVDSGQYYDLLTEFSKSIEISSESTEIESGGANVKCKKIWFTVTDEQIIKLLNDLYDLIEDDDDLRKEYESILGSDLLSGMSGMSYRDGLKTVKDGLREVERNLSGEITFSLFVGNRDRLLAMEMDANLKIEGEKTQLVAKYDFGASAQDRWTVNITMSAGGDRQTIKMVWDYKDSSGKIENSFSVTSPDDSKVTLKSVWSPENGRYTLSYASTYEDWFGETNEDTGEITGVFTTDGTSFRLSVNDIFPDDEDESFTLEIKGEQGAQIKQIDFIGVDQWGMTFMTKLQDLFYELS